LNGVIVELHEHLDQFLGFFKLANGQIDQQFQFQNGELAPHSVLIKLDTDQGDDGHVHVQLSFFEPLHQIGQFVFRQAVQVEDVFPEFQRHVGVVPDQVFHRIHLGIARHQDTADRSAQIFKYCHVALFAYVFENAEQAEGFFLIGAGKVPLDKFVVGSGTEETPGHHAAGVDEVFHVVVGLGHRHGVKGGRRQVVQALKTAALQQLGQAAFQCHVEAWVSAEGGKHPAGFRVHQSHAHHRELAAQRGVFHQHRKALIFQGLDAFDDIRVLGQNLVRYIRQGDFVLDDFFFYRPLEDFRQALYLGFRQGVASTHSVAQVQVFNQVGGEVHGFAVGLAQVWDAADASLWCGGVGVEQVGAEQFTVRVVNLETVIVQYAVRQFAFGAGLEPLLSRIMHERAVGDVLTEVLVVVEEVAVQAFDELAQGGTQGGFLGRAFAIGETHGGGGIANAQRPDMGHNVAPGGDFDFHAQVRQYAAHVGNGGFQGQILAFDVGIGFAFRLDSEQCLGVFIQVFHHFNLEIRAGLHSFFDGAAVDRAQNAL